MITATVVGTPLGFAAIATRGEMLVAVSLPLPTRDQAIERVSEDLGELLEEGECRIARLPERITAYFSGETVDFSDTRVDLSYAGPFEALVLERVQRIPYGSVVTYGELAAQAGSPRAARAVGNVMARNRSPLIIPCHRVVRSGRTAGDRPCDTVGGFAYGTDTKKAMLRIEGVII